MAASILSPPHPAYVGRLAPSPTGAQHVGNARTYLIAWLAARRHNGRIILRIEDIDSPRVKPHAVEQTCADLRWLGLDWDEGPVLQSRRLRLYEWAFARLRSAERVYPCTCTRKDVETAASAPHAEHEGPVYPGTCAGRRVAEADSLGDRPFCWRFRATSSVPTFVDGFLGPQQPDPKSAGGDFVVYKSDRTPAYQLAVVVDDADQSVTEVIRGDDLVSSTPRQIQLYQALSLQPPEFTHVPLVVGPDGRRLAKRHGDTRLASLRSAGIPPGALLGLLAWSCGWIDGIEPIGLADLLPRYALQTIPRTPFILEPRLLAHIGYSA